MVLWYLCQLEIIFMHVLPIVRAESIKMEPQTRINVDFKPNKKMRKRRELDALVSNGKNRRLNLPTSTKKGQHELLRSVDDDEDEESSEEIEFTLSAQNKSVIRKKRKPCWCGSGYIPICAFILVVLCLLVCGGLIWFLYDLRREVGSLQSEIATVESRNQDVPDEFQSVHTHLKNLQTTVEGERGIHHINSQIQVILKQISLLNETTVKLSQGQAGAKTLLDLPARVQQIETHAVTLGSTVSKLDDFRKQAETNYQQLAEEVKDIKAQLENSATPSPKPLDSRTEEENQSKENLRKLADGVMSVNSSLNTLSQRVAQLESKLLMSPVHEEHTNVPSALQTIVDQAINQFSITHQSEISTLDDRISHVNETLYAVRSDLTRHASQIYSLNQTLDTLQRQFTVSHPVNHDESSPTINPQTGLPSLPAQGVDSSDVEGVTSDAPSLSMDSSTPNTDMVDSPVEERQGANERSDDFNHDARRRRSLYKRRPVS